MNSVEKKFFFLCFLLSPLLGLLVPLVNSGFIGDDSIQSFIGGTLGFYNRSLTDEIIRYFLYWWPSRINGIPFFYFIFIFVEQNIIFFKLFIFSLFVLCCLSAWLLFSGKYEKIKFSELFLIISSLIFFREYGDPFLSFYGSAFISLTFVLITIFLLKNTSHSALGYFCLFIFSISSALSYEFNGIILLLYCLFCIFYKISPSVEKHIFVVFLCSLILVSKFFLMMFYGNESQILDTGYRIEFDLFRAFNAFLYSKIFSLPGTAYFAESSSWIGAGVLLVIATPLGLIAIILFGRSCQILMNLRASYADHRDVSDLHLLGCLLVIIPTAVLCLSEKYLNELGAGGRAYQDSFYSVIGFVVLWFLHRKDLLDWKRAPRPRVYCFFRAWMVCLALGQIWINWHVVSALNEFWKTPRVFTDQLVKLAADEGRDRPFIFFGDNYPWVRSDYVVSQAGHSRNSLSIQGVNGAFGGIYTPVDQVRAVPGFPTGVLFDDLKSTFPNVIPFFTSLSRSVGILKFPSGEAYFLKIVKSYEGVIGGVCSIENAVVSYEKILGMYCRSVTLIGPSRVVKKFEAHLQNRVGALLNLKYSYYPDLVRLDVTRNDSTALDGLDIFSSISERSVSFPVNAVISETSDSIVVESDNEQAFYFEIDKPISRIKEIVLDLNDYACNSEKNRRLVHLLGNHPGDGAEGFVIQGVWPELYLSKGNGSGWTTLKTIHPINGPFILRLSLNGKSVSIYMNDKLLYQFDKDSIVSTSPIQVGDWLHRGRAYCGTLNLISIDLEPPNDN